MRDSTVFFPVTMNGFSLRETCTWCFFSWHWFCLWSLLRTEFYSWNFLCTDFIREPCSMLIFLFVKLVHWSFSPRETDFVLKTYYVLVIVRETSYMLIFVRETCYMLAFLFVKREHSFSPFKTAFVYGNCWVLFYVRAIFCVLIFLFLKLVHWFFSQRNSFCSWNLLNTDYCS